MKKQLLVAVLALASTGAFASKARMVALGQDAAEGAPYIADSRMVFGNPAFINMNKDYIITEWGQANSNTGVINNTRGADSNAVPRAEGGFFRSTNKLVYGVYFGNENTWFENKKNDATATYLAEANSVDLFIGGDAGIQWGARVHFSNSSEEQTFSYSRSQRSVAAEVGIVSGPLDSSLSLDLYTYAEGDGSRKENEFKGQFNAAYDVTYVIKDGHTVSLLLSSKGAKNQAATTTKYRDNTFIALYGYQKEFNSKARMFVDGSAVYATTNVDGGAAEVKTKAYSLPVTIAFEADANSWLTLRGSVKENIWAKNKNAAGKDANDRSTAAVAAGATLNFGNLKVDGVIGNDENGNGAAQADTAGGILRLDSLMSRVSVGYWF